MKGVNKVIIIGYLGAKPEVHQFANGNRITTLSIATSNQWTDANGQLKESTEWHKIKLSNRLGEVAAEYLNKGSKVYIEGSLRTRKRTDDNGLDRYITEIYASSMQMLGNSNRTEMQKPEVAAPTSQKPWVPKPTNDVLEDDLPF
ncbi:MAG: single-strand DNA-binding protein [Enterobacterales bacterium]|jgi:single-strand DNA-binding protein